MADVEIERINGNLKKLPLLQVRNRVNVVSFWFFKAWR